MKSRIALVSAIFTAALSGCATGPKPATVNDLAGEWKGEWTWKSEDGGLSDQGPAGLSFRRLDGGKWNVEITAERSSIPGGKVTLNVDEKSPMEIAGEYQGGTIKITLAKANPAGAKVSLQLAHPLAGTAAGEGVMTGNLMRINYTTLEGRSRRGLGTISLERTTAE